MIGYDRLAPWCAKVYLGGVHLRFACGGVGGDGQPHDLPYEQVESCLVVAEGIAVPVGVELVGIAPCCGHGQGELLLLQLLLGGAGLARGALVAA